MQTAWRGRGEQEKRTVPDDHDGRLAASEGPLGLVEPTLAADARAGKPDVAARVADGVRLFCCGFVVRVFFWGCGGGCVCFQRGSKRAASRAKRFGTRSAAGRAAAVAATAACRRREGIRPLQWSAFVQIFPIDVNQRDKPIIIVCLTAWCRDPSSWACASLCGQTDLSASQALAPRSRPPRRR